MLKKLDAFLNTTTMYRVVLYGLTLLIVTSFILSFSGLLTYSPLSLLLSLVVSFSVSIATHALYAKLYRAPAHIESSYITAMILFLILPPVVSPLDAGWVAMANFIAITSKYIFEWKNKHIFNPAALAAFVLSLTGATAATWWIGSTVLLPIALIVGIIVVKKIRRLGIFLSCVTANTVVSMVFAKIHEAPLGESFIQHLTSSPIIFFASIMVTEPLETPPTKSLQLLYGSVVGALSSLPFSFGILYGTPELALLMGNALSHFISRTTRPVLTLIDKKEVARDTYEFIFSSSNKIDFKAGQYLEWTLPHTQRDLRGMRRYFTIASSPTESNIHLGIKVCTTSSTFKKTLCAMNTGDHLLAGPVSGDFVLPNDHQQKLVFIAGGIGVTPFRSMVQYLIDTHDAREATLFYANRTEADIAYRDLFEQAVAQKKINVVHVLSGADVPASWQGERGYVSDVLIKKYVPDFKTRLFYISGPSMMVDMMKKTLTSMGVAHKNIKTDYFPGFA